MGDRDLVLGAAFLKSLAKKARFPFISANIFKPGTDELLFTPFVVQTVAGIKVAIVGAVSPAVALPRNRPAADWEIKDPVASIRRVAGALAKEKPQVVLLLSQLSPEETKNVVAGLTSTTVVLGTNQPKQQAYPEQLGDVLVTHGFMRGKFLDVVTLFVPKGSTARRAVYRDGATRIKAEVASLDERIRKFEGLIKNLKGDNETDQRRAAGFVATIERTVKQREELVQRAASYKAVDVKAPFVQVDFVAMDRNRPEDDGIRALVQAFNKQYPPQHGAPVPAAGVKGPATLKPEVLERARALRPGLRIHPPGGAAGPGPAQAGGQKTP